MSTDDYSETSSQASPARSTRLQDVSLVYGNTAPSMRSASTCRPGAWSGLIGPDGVGKSSLLALIAGAATIQQGQVEVLGGDMADAGFRRGGLPADRLHAAGSGQEPLPDPVASSRTSTSSPGCSATAAPSAERRIAELLDSIGLGAFPDRPAGKLSGGMKQKLGLCCALIHDPDLLILDEPTTGVDPLSRRQFWELIDRIRGRPAGHERPGFDRLHGGGRTGSTGSWRWTPARCWHRHAGGVAWREPAPRPWRRPSSPSCRRRCARPPRAGASRRARRANDEVDHRGARPDAAFRRLSRRSITSASGSSAARSSASSAPTAAARSTTMKMLTGLLPPTEGKASLFGQSVDADDIDVRRKRRLHVAGLLALFRADGAAEPGPARPAL